MSRISCSLHTYTDNMEYPAKEVVSIYSVKRDPNSGQQSQQGRRSSPADKELRAIQAGRHARTLAESRPKKAEQVEMSSTLSTAEKRKAQSSGQVSSAAWEEMEKETTEETKDDAKLGK